jgi:hypothetical protein
MNMNMNINMNMGVGVGVDMDIGGGASGMGGVYDEVLDHRYPGWGPPAAGVAGGVGMDVQMDVPMDGDGMGLVSSAGGCGEGASGYAVARGY